VKLFNTFRAAARSEIVLIDMRVDYQSISSFWVARFVWCQRPMQIKKGTLLLKFNKETKASEDQCILKIKSFKD
jgi:uncharacterized protein (DUF1919 family)